MLMCIHIVSGTLVSSFRTEQNFSLITDKVNPLSSTWVSVVEYSNKYSYSNTTRVPIFEYSYSITFYCNSTRTRIFM